MSRVSMFSSPFLLGFDELERMLDRASKTSGDGYPPYNIERLPRAEGEAERLRITLAVAGFSRDELEVTVEENQLVIRGRQQRGSRTGHIFTAASPPASSPAPSCWPTAWNVTGARLENGLLIFSLERPEPRRVVRRIQIGG